MNEDDGKKNDTETNIQLIFQNLGFIKDQITESTRKIDNLDKKIDSNYVTKDQLETLKQRVTMLEKIVYGFVAVVLLAVIGALVSLVLIK